MKLEDDKWSQFNLLIDQRKDASIVTTKNATYIFGGIGSKNSIEFLRHDSNIWQQGPSIPFNHFQLGCGVSISDSEILLIGGTNNERSILKITTIDN